MSRGFGHVPVMLEEVLELLRPRPGGRYADLTLGAGGHAEALLERSSPEGRVVGFDRDPRALEIAGDRLRRFGERFESIRCDFSGAATILRDRGEAALDGVLLDVGVSSMQLDDPERGFGFAQDGPLDMRMSGSGRITAERLLATEPEEEIERILREYGEEPRSRDIARRIVELRRRTRITRTRELAELVRSVTGTRGRVHPATRTFQALRIAVNRELEALETALPRMAELLAAGGRLAVISFHSLEDRIVKELFREEEERGRGRVLTSKPVRPGPAEVRANRRSRSARLRALEKT